MAREGSAPKMTRPTMVSGIAVVLFVATAIAAVTGTSLAFPGTLLDRLWDLNPQAYAGFQTLGRVAGALLWLIGSVACSAGLGLLRRKRWAWWLSIALFAITGGGDAFNMVVRRDWMRSGVGVCISGGFLLALILPGVRGFFRRSAVNGGAGEPIHPG